MLSWVTCARYASFAVCLSRYARCPLAMRASQFVYLAMLDVQTISKKKVLDKCCYICYSMKYEHFDRKDMFYV